MADQNPQSVSPELRARVIQETLGKIRKHEEEGAAQSAVKPVVAPVPKGASIPTGKGLLEQVMENKASQVGEEKELDEVREAIIDKTDPSMVKNLMRRMM